MDSTQPKILHAGIDLAIAGLPSEVTHLASGEIYAVLTDSISTRFSIVIQSLAANLNKGKHCTIISRLDGDEFIKRANSLGLDVVKYIKNRHLTVILLTQDFMREFNRSGVKQLIAEFDYYGIKSDSYLVMDAIAELFSLHDPGLALDQFAAYKHWVKQNNITVIVTFSKHTQLEFPRAYEIVSEQFSGIMNVTLSHNHMQAKLDPWYTESALSFPLNLDVDMTRKTCSNSSV